ncbi:MAG TPA: DUF349 domain-containing protein, partial [Burkholderiaceae bacterium]|nr:DUF349 domain-containing protein [Burkholderiaceae bacterium]
ALWQRFRCACDSVFERHKGVAAAANEERRRQLRAKEGLCAALENAEGMSAAQAAETLRVAAREWSAIGPVPRAAENAIRTRYEAAVAALRSRMEAHRKAEMEAGHRALCAKLRLCQEIEAALVGCDSVEASLFERWNAAWQALPALATPIEQRMRKRFEAALDAFRRHDRQYADNLRQGRDALLKELLRAEILLGMDSPAYLAQERLQLQVEVLRSAFKSDRNAQAHDAQLLRLCEIAALVDGDAASRLERVTRTVSV